MKAERKEEIRKAAEAATYWKNEVVVDKCRTCTEAGKEGEFNVPDIEGGYHAMFANRVDAEYIALMSPSTALELLSEIFAMDKLLERLARAAEDYRSNKTEMVDFMVEANIVASDWLSNRNG